MTSSVAAIEPVRRSIEIEVPAAEAFAIYTQEIASWWVKEHHIGKTPFVDVVMEPRVGGRYYEVSADGTECDWGKVLVWEPPLRVVTSWHLGGDWKFHPELEKASEVEVRFVPLGEMATRIELEHRHFERHDGGEVVAAGVGSPGGWGKTLEGIRAYAEARKVSK
jgi:uncharacterized protein YndB with AHSA1/START domain